MEKVRELLQKRKNPKTGALLGKNPAQIFRLWVPRWPLAEPHIQLGILEIIQNLDIQKRFCAGVGIGVYPMNSHQNHGVIANNIGQSQAVISNTKSENRRAFDAWATVFSKSEKDRQRYMQNDNYAMCLWWLRRDKEFRAYLLFRACGEDAGRYTDAAWSALPEGVRREIALACRRVARDAQGCAWW